MRVLTTGSVIPVVTFLEAFQEDPVELLLGGIGESLSQPLAEEGFPQLGKFRRLSGASVRASLRGGFPGKPCDWVSVWGPSRLSTYVGVRAFSPSVIIHPGTPIRHRAVGTSRVEPILSREWIHRVAGLDCTVGWAGLDSLALLADRAAIPSARPRRSWSLPRGVGCFPTQSRMAAALPFSA